MKTKTMPKSSRFAAIETLHLLAKTKSPVSHIFDRVVNDCNLSRSDKQLTMKICYGVLRQKDFLDYILSQLCRQPLGTIKPFVYHALTVGLYQLFFLDRIPPSAAVNETVNAIRTARLPRQLQGFVNGVLRQSIRKKNEFPDPNDQSKQNHLFLNHPDWLRKRWETSYGLQTMQKICFANNQEPVTCIRITNRTTVQEYTKLLADKDIHHETAPYAPEALLLPGFQRTITELPGFQEGLFQVQDQSAQLATYLLGPFRDGESYLDCCAGLGGKTTHLASLTEKKKCQLTALEPTPYRFRQLNENLARTAEPGQVTLYNETLERFTRSCMVRFDKILIDAPCSGTGVIGRQPDIRWNRTCQDILSYQSRQLLLLEEAANLLQPGGVMVYATCSIESEENQDVIDQFLRKHHHFSLSDSREMLPSTAHQLIKNRCFAPIPSQGTDGFFAARLVSSA